MFDFKEASVIRYPSGEYGFVGAVPAVLAFEYDSEEDLKVALSSGPGIATKIAKANGRHFATRTWDTEGAALAAKAELGL